MELSIPVSRIAFGGDGVGRLPDGKVCFVPGALPGETVRAGVVRETKSFARAALLQVLNASPERREPDCPLAGTCPGCVYRHASYDCELGWKNRQFTDFLTRGNPAAGDIRFLPPLGAPSRNGCRNKLAFVCENGAFCYRGFDNRTAVPVQDCLLGHPAIRELLMSAEPGADGQKRTFRRTAHDGALDSGSDAWRRITHLTERLGAFGDFRVPKASFFQVNIDMAPKLAERVLTLLKETGTERLLELYCGSGVFSILAAETIHGLTARAVELDAAAIEAAEFNAARHGISDRCTFLAADADAAFHTLASSCAPAGCCVLVDPPRTGLPASLVQEIGRFAPSAVLYVSCAPDTLRRDADRLAEHGYVIQTAGMVDMFPATGHFESVSLFRRSA
ncbi:MAG: class I SAM-dependent RNA methyltransferase [Lentisphaeria bacterium]|jgi:tRNA/tmRNA/rRNA uracil-C5-methylase (TrmA/RlmC/RlmD family)|nr:class I SAM-dependent RNA methyltransferase [Lentisphaeria bacterium]